MDIVWGFQFLLTGVIAILGWNFKALHAKSEATGRELADYKTQVATFYVTEAQLARSLDTVERSLQMMQATLQRVEERLYAKEQRVIT